MRRSEDMPLEPEVLAELEVIDATLAGLAVDPEHAELAELALLVATTRAEPSEEYIRSLDARAQRRFVRHAPAHGRHHGLRRLSLGSARPVIGSVLVGGLALATAAVVISTGSLSSSSTAPEKNSFGTTAHQSVHRGAQPAVNGSRSTADFGGSETATPANPDRSASAGADVVPAPVSGTGGYQIQSAQLQLTTPNARIDEVAQEVFDVVAQVGGTVQRSQVTAASGSSSGDSYASFVLNIPTASLQEAMTRMSSLRYATVASRTDGTQNVSNQYQTDQRNIADDKAVRLALLTQLESAETETAIDSIEAQLKLAASQLASDQKALSSLQHQIDYSSLNVQVNPGPPIFPVTTAANHGFTLGRAAHDSGRVLVVAAGVALIVLALLVPLVLVAVLLAWIGSWLRRRRREQALDVS